jgi:hypothetical protein
MKPATRGFQTPPDITRYFEQKSLRPAFSWQDVWGQEHAYAFTVAKAVDLELLTLFKTSMQRAIDKGEGFESWREKLVPELQRLGWYGKRKVDDPTGAWRSKIVDFSRPRRLETIFWSNVRAARAAGQWERIQRTKAGLPYLLYVRTASAEPRQEHLAWVGIILPVDDPFWSTHFPPNGWHCKCSVRQITRFEYDKLKDKDGYSTDPPAIEQRIFTNDRTGEITRIPVGVDPGWHTNPGLARAKTLVDNVSARLEAAGEDAARARIAEIVNSPAPKLLMGIGEPFALPVATAGRFLEDMRAKSRLIVAFNATMSRKVEKHEHVDPDSFRLVQQIVDGGEIIDEDRGEDFRTLVAEIEGAWWKLVLKRSAQRFLRVQTFLRTNSHEIGRLRRKQERIAKTKAGEA